MYNITIHTVCVSPVTYRHSDHFKSRVRRDRIRWHHEGGTVLEDIIGSGEGKTVEFKQDIPKDVMRYIPTVVAFSNTIGGMMIFGVSDSGEVTGIE